MAGRGGGDGGVRGAREGLPGLARGGRYPFYATSDIRRVDGKPAVRARRKAGGAVRAAQPQAVARARWEAPGATADERCAGETEFAGGDGFGLRPATAQPLSRPASSLAVLDRRMEAARGAAREIPESLIPLDSLLQANQTEGVIWPLANVLAGRAYPASPSSDVDIRAISRWVAWMRKRIELSESADAFEQADDLEDVYYMAFHELARQVMTTSFERGELLLSLFHCHRDVLRAQSKAEETLRLTQAAKLDELKNTVRNQEERIASLKQQVAENTERAGGALQQRAATADLTHAQRRALDRSRRSSSGRRVTVNASGAMAMLDGHRARRKSSVFDSQTLHRLSRSSTANSLRDLNSSTADDEDGAGEHRKSLTPFFHKFFRNMEDELGDGGPRDESEERQFKALYGADENELKVDLLQEDLRAALEHVTELEEQNEEAQSRIKELEEAEAKRSAVESKAVQTEACAPEAAVGLGALRPDFPVPSEAQPARRGSVLVSARRTLLISASTMPAGDLGDSAAGQRLSPKSLRAAGTGTSRGNASRTDGEGSPGGTNRRENGILSFSASEQQLLSVSDANGGSMGKQRQSKSSSRVGSVSGSNANAQLGGPATLTVPHILRESGDTSAMSLTWALKATWQIYQERIETPNVATQPLSEFVYDFYLRKYGLPAVAMRHICTLIKSAFHHQLHHGVGLFLRFFEGKLKVQVLQFYLRGVELCRSPEAAATTTQGTAKGQFKRVHEHTTRRHAVFPESDEGAPNWVALNRVQHIIATLYPALPFEAVERIVGRCSGFMCLGDRKEWAKLANHVREVLVQTERVDRDIFLFSFISEIIQEQQPFVASLSSLFDKGEVDQDGMLGYLSFCSLARSLNADTTTETMRDLFKEALALTHSTKPGAHGESISRRAFISVCAAHHLASRPTIISK